MTPIPVLHSRELIEMIVWFEAKMIGLMLLYTVGLMIVRRRIQAAEDNYREFYGGLLADELLESDMATLRMPNWRHPIRRRVLQQVILSHLDFLTGTEREKIIRTYLRLGYVAVDLEHLNSWFWWNRLQAVSNLRLLELSELAPIMDRARFDKNPFVAIAALVALSGTDHALNTPALLDNLPLEVLSRNNVMLEVVTNIGRLRGYEALVEYLGYRYPLRLNEACISALTASATPENAAIVAELLRDRLPKQIVLRILGFVQKVGDPAHSLLIRPYLQHQDATVRAEAARFLLTVGDGTPSEMATLLGADASAEVRRILAANEDRSAA